MKSIRIRKMAALFFLLVLCGSNFLTVPILAEEEELSEEQTEEIAENEETVESIEEDTNDYSMLEGIDFSSMRLIVKGEVSVDENDRVLGNLDNYQLIQYESIEQTKDAYLRYLKTAELVICDIYVSINNSVSSNIQMTEIENPFAKASEYLESNAQIAVIDTGSSYGTNITCTKSLVGENDLDANGHGTETMNAIVSQNKNAKIASIKAFDESGNGSISSVYAAIVLASKMNIKYLVLPFNIPVTAESELISMGIEKIAEQGIVVVGSAGDNNVDTSLYIPGNHGNVVIAGACDASGIKTELSNYGSNVDYNVLAQSSSIACAKLAGALSIDGTVMIDNKLIFDPNEEESMSVQSESSGNKLFTSGESEAIINLAKQIFDAHKTTYKDGGRSFWNTSYLDCAGFVNYILYNVNRSKFGSYCYNGYVLGDGQGGGMCNQVWWANLLRTKGVSSTTHYFQQENPDFSDCNPGDLICFYEGNVNHHIGIYAGNGMIYHCTIGPVDLGVYGRANEGVRYDPLNQMDELNCSDLTHCVVYHTAEKYSASVIEGYSLSLSGRIGVNYYVSLPNYVKNNSNAYLLFTKDTGGTQKILVTDSSEVTVGNQVCNVFPVYFNSKEMTTTVKVEVVTDHTEMIDDSFTVKKYAEYILNRSNQYDKKTVDIARSLLRYGAQTQNYFNYKVDSLPTNLDTYETYDLSSYDMNVISNSENVTFIGSRLVLKDTLGLKLYFSGEGEAYVNGSQVSTTKENKYTVITVDSMNPNDLGEKYTIQYENYEMEFSAISYMYQAQKTDNEDLINLCISLYEYYLALNE